MKYFYEFVLYCTELELALAKKVPVRNPKYIKDLERDLAKWELALKLYEVNHA